MCSKAWPQRTYGTHCHIPTATSYYVEHTQRYYTHNTCTRSHQVGPQSDTFHRGRGEVPARPSRLSKTICLTKRLEVEGTAATLRDVSPTVKWRSDSRPIVPACAAMPVGSESIANSMQSAGKGADDERGREDGVSRAVKKRTSLRRIAPAPAIPPESPAVTWMQSAGQPGGAVDDRRGREDVVPGQSSSRARATEQQGGRRDEGEVVWPERS